MSTNYYVCSDKPDIFNKYGLFYEIIDKGSVLQYYESHIAKQSVGYIPLYQSHECIKSKKDLLQLIHEPDITIYNEYNKQITLEWFETNIINYIPKESDNNHLRELVPNYAFVSTDGGVFMYSDFV